MATHNPRRAPIGQLSLFDNLRASSAVPAQPPSAPRAASIDAAPVDIAATASDILDEPIPPIILPAARVVAGPSSPGPDHVCTADDFVTGAAARFDANLAAIEVLQSIEANSRQASPEEQRVLARFSGFGDSTFEPAFRLTPLRKEDQPWVERG